MKREAREAGDRARADRAKDRPAPNLDGVTAGARTRAGAPRQSNSSTLLGLTRRGTASIVASPVLVGAVTVLIIVVSVFLAYNANQGLPFVPTYDLKAELPSGPTWWWGTRSGWAASGWGRWTRSRRGRCPRAARRARSRWWK